MVDLVLLPYTYNVEERLSLVTLNPTNSLLGCATGYSNGLFSLFFRKENDLLILNGFSGNKNFFARIVGRPMEMLCHDLNFEGKQSTNIMFPVNPLRLLLLLCYFLQIIHSSILFFSCLVYYDHVV